ncbi:MAG TPA: M20/M25/M40 family metallo-hydrolase [Thermoanaerobaculia bacterium]|nr:M20/M25/M40 family metallo-hydrolase [Thermoanaerobaculia bacterium]
MRLRRSLLAALIAAGACRRAPPPLTRQQAADVTRPAEDWLREEPVKLLRDYVRIDTRPAHGEREGAEFLKRILDCDGIETEIVCPVGDRCNLFARLPGREHDGALMLLNHIDVVEAYPQYWKEAAPFEGRIKDGYLYGRGAFDMKSLGLAQALALRALRRKGVVPQRDIVFLAEADEEIGQKWGARWLLDHRPEFFRGVGQVLNEGGTTEVILRDVRFWGLETLQAGYGFAEFDAPAQAPLEALASRWPKLVATSIAPHPHVVEGFNLLANHLSSPLTDPLRHLDRVIRDPAELAILPDRYGAFLEPRLNWSPFYVNPETPGRPRRLLVVSVPPGVDPAKYLQPIIEDAKRSGVGVVLTSWSEVTVASPYPTAFTDLLKRVTEAHFPGVPFGPVPTFGGYTTSILLRQRGIPAYGYASIPTNITDAARRHSNDERIYLRDYLTGVGLYIDVLEEFATNPPRVK